MCSSDLEMSFARDVADTVVFMDQGRIVEQGPPAQVIDSPAHERTRSFLQRVSAEAAGPSAAGAEATDADALDSARAASAGPATAGPAPLGAAPRTPSKDPS